LTDAAMRSLGYSDPARFFSGSENYQGIGEIKTHILLPGGAVNKAPAKMDKKSPGFPLHRIRTAALIFEAMTRLSSAKIKPEFHYLP